jgi:hypothetical protein
VERRARAAAKVSLRENFERARVFVREERSRACPAYCVSKFFTLDYPCWLRVPIID